MTAYPSRSGRTLGPLGDVPPMGSTLDGTDLSFILTTRGAVVFRGADRVGTVTRSLSYGWTAEAGGTSWPVSGSFEDALAAVAEVVS